MDCKSHGYSNLRSASEAHSIIKIAATHDIEITSVDYSFNKGQKLYGQLSEEDRIKLADNINVSLKNEMSKYEKKDDKHINEERQSRRNIINNTTLPGDSSPQRDVGFRPGHIALVLVFIIIFGVILFSIGSNDRHEPVVHTYEKYYKDADGYLNSKNVSYLTEDPNDTETAGFVIIVLGIVGLVILKKLR